MLFLPLKTTLDKEQGPKPPLDSTKHYIANFSLIVDESIYLTTSMHFSASAAKDLSTCIAKCPFIHNEFLKKVP